MKVIILLCVLLTACTRTEAVPEFEIATWASGKELEEFNAVIDSVNKRAKGRYMLKTVSIPSDYYETLLKHAKGKNLPDFFWLTQEVVPFYAASGYLADLTQFMEQSHTMTPGRFYRAARESVKYQDRYWGIPWISNPFIVYYNKTMLEALDIEPPTVTDSWKWKHFIDMCRSIAGKTYRGKKLVATVFDGSPNIETLIWSGGGDILAKDRKTVVLNSPESAHGLYHLVVLLREQLIPQYDELNASARVYFERQESAFFLGGIADDVERTVQALPESERFEIGYAPIPANPNGKSNPFNWMAATVMSSRVENKKLAYEALEAVSHGFFDWKIAPPIKETVNTIAAINPYKVAALPTIEHALQNARSAYYTKQWPALSYKYLWEGLYLPILKDPKTDYQLLLQDAAENLQKNVEYR